MLWDDKPYYSLNYYLKETFGEKVFKISLDAGCTCPNRDGTLDTRGCIFCSKGGSGDFASSRRLSISEQIEDGKERLSKKFKGRYYIAYFQAFTNTYGDWDYLKSLYEEAANHPDIVGISIATRPDCLTEDMCRFFEDLKQKVHVWIELGLQSIHENSARFMRRGYSLVVYDQAIQLLTSYNIDVIVHLILGLPNESREDVLETVKYITKQPIQGIKLQLLQVLKETDLADIYHRGDYSPLDFDSYLDILLNCISHIPDHIVIHRLTGDAPWKLLIAPAYSTDKKNNMNKILRAFKDRGIYQGKAHNSVKSDS